MELPLTAYQRQLAEQRIMFDHPLASDLEEALRRASLACAENGKKETGLIEFFCGCIYTIGKKSLITLMEISTQYSHGLFQSIVTALKVLYPMQSLRRPPLTTSLAGFPIR
jgi:hypothetical protein